MGKEVLSKNLRTAFVKYWAGNAKATHAAMTKDGYKIALGTCQKFATYPEIKKQIATPENKPGILEKEDLQKRWSEWIDDDKMDMPVRLKASELLGKSKGAFIDKVEHSGHVSIKDLLE